MLGTNRSRVGVLRDTRHAMGEVVKESHDEGVRPFRVRRPGYRGGLVELPTGNHVTLTRCCGASASGTFLGTV
jgi:hypothetical protein